MTSMTMNLNQSMQRCIQNCEDCHAVFQPEASKKMKESNDEK